MDSNGYASAAFLKRKTDNRERTVMPTTLSLYGKPILFSLLPEYNYNKNNRLTSLYGFLRYVKIWLYLYIGTYYLLQLLSPEKL